MKGADDMRLGTGASLITFPFKNSRADYPATAVETKSTLVYYDEEFGKLYYERYPDGTAKLVGRQSK